MLKFLDKWIISSLQPLNSIIYTSLSLPSVIVSCWKLGIERNGNRNRPVGLQNIVPQVREMDLQNTLPRQRDVEAFAA